MKMNRAICHSGNPARIIRNSVKSITYSALSPELLYLLHPCSRGYRIAAARLPV